MVKLRDYQRDTIDKMISSPKGTKLIIKQATGLGKTVQMAQYCKEVNERHLIIVNRDELVWQTVEKLKELGIDDVGIEKAESNGKDERIIVASIQSLSRKSRLVQYAPNTFYSVLSDEVHMCASKTYHTVLDYFKSDYRWGFSATPFRADHIRLDDLFDGLLCDYDILWGIEHGYLCNIRCRQVKLNIDLSNVKKSNGDYNLQQLDEAMDDTSPAVAEVYEKYRTGKTLIFSTSVKKAYEISELVPNSKVIEANTPLDDRREWIEQYKNGDIDCLISMGTLTTGFDAPKTETIIWARPTINSGLVIQAIGRGTRIAEGKKCCHVIDVTTSTSVINLCSPACLIGYDMPEVAKERLKEKEEYDLFDIPEICDKLADIPETWIKSIREVNLLKRKLNLDMRDINFRKRGDGSLNISLPNKITYTIPPIDSFGNVTFSNGVKVPVQVAIDKLFIKLRDNHMNDSAIWSKSRFEKWGKEAASAKQLNIIRHSGYDLTGLNLGDMSKGEASLILNEIFLRK